MTCLMRVLYIYIYTSNTRTHNNIYLRETKAKIFARDKIERNHKLLIVSRPYRSVYVYVPSRHN